MTYRNDRDADQARIAALEGDLADARYRIAELEGRREHALVLASPQALARAGGRVKMPWYGAPLRLELRRTFEGAFPVDQLEDLVELIRSITRDPGRTELLRSSMTWSASSRERGAGPFTIVTVSIREGRTTLTATDRLGALAGAIYGGLGGGLGGGGMAVPLTAGLALGMPGLFIPLVLGAWFGSVFFGTRAVFRHAARTRAQDLQQLFDAVAREIDAALERSRSEAQ